MTQKKVKTENTEQELYTKAQVIKLLQQQINDCAESIQSDNLSEYSAKLKIMNTKIVEI